MGSMGQLYHFSVHQRVNYVIVLTTEYTNKINNLEVQQKACDTHDPALRGGLFALPLSGQNNNSEFFYIRQLKDSAIGFGSKARGFTPELIYVTEYFFKNKPLSDIP